MQYLGFLITLLVFLELYSAAPDREKRQLNSSPTLPCVETFGVSCSNSENITLNSDTPNCECVPYYRCNNPANKAVLVDRSIRRQKIGCSGAFEVCCEAEFIVRDTTNCECVPYYQCSTLDRPTIIDSRKSQCSEVLEVCCEAASIVNDTMNGTPSPIPVKEGCGHINPDGIIVRVLTTENTTQFAELPWMVAISKKTPEKRQEYVGGGSLIHPRAILTSAHVVGKYEPADLNVRAGEWDTQSVLEPIPHSNREVDVVILHEKSNSLSLHNDLAILILKEPFDLAPNINVVCLPDESDVFEAVKCTATGWGKDKLRGSYNKILKKIKVPVVPHAPCQTALRTTRLGNAFVLDPSFICAGGEPGLDTCKGDGGSPLACPLANNPDRYVQVGIVAWGINCGDDGIPGVYANVAKARRWIDSKMAQYNLDTSSYIP